MKIVPAEVHELPSCPCCSAASRLIVGRVDGDIQSEYNVHVTDGPMHEPCAGFYIVFAGGIAVALEVIVAGSGKFMFGLIDANTAPIANDPSVTRALPAAEVFGTPLADRASEIVDAAMNEDPRLRDFSARGDATRAHAIWSRRMAQRVARPS